jgi:polyhydroxybutyrate depolymerase
VAKQTGFSDDADREGFLVVYPDGIEHNWNDGRGTTDAERLGVDDVKFVRALIEELTRTFPIDPARIYATGVSNGGIFTHRLGCELADVLAAIGPVIGPIASPMASRCRSSRPISVIGIQGTADPFIPIQGGEEGWQSGLGDGGLVESAEDTMALWAAKNGCAPTPRKDTLPARVNDGTHVQRIVYSPCRDGTEVHYYLVDGMGHGWPPKPPRSERLSGRTSQNLNATELIWEFFQPHPKSGADFERDTDEIRDNEPFDDGPMREDEQAEGDFGAPQSTQRLYDYFEQRCLRSGWKKVAVNVEGNERRLLWNGPRGEWRRGAIIVMHGGGGTFSNYCSNIRLGKPMVDFGKLALLNGFAVFSLDSTDGLSTDAEGNSCGKRFDSTAHADRPNVDVGFIKNVINEVIPRYRPQDSSDDIFVAGISNGGFMTTLAATQFADTIKAFAPISSGDPYGTYMDCRQELYSQRKNAAGTWRDNETGKEINQPGACVSDSYPNEEQWPSAPAGRMVAFKQFQHQGDAGVDFSCMQKTNKQLVRHGFQDDGAYVIPSQNRHILNHFWMAEYNAPLIDFFKRRALRTSGEN